MEAKKKKKMFSRKQVKSSMSHVIKVRNYCFNILRQSNFFNVVEMFSILLYFQMYSYDPKTELFSVT